VAELVAISSVLSPGSKPCGVDAVRGDVLAGFEPKTPVVERDGDFVRFERDVVAYPGDLGPGVGVGPGRAVAVGLAEQDHSAMSNSVERFW
jgi:hypothetical protein